MAEQQKSGKRHVLTLDSRERITATGVKKVDFCSEELIIAQTELGQLNIKGKNLHIENLSAETGDLLVRGTPGAVSYTEKSETLSFFGRIFK